MNINTAALTTIIAAVFGAGSLTVAALNAFVAKGGRRADIADKVSQAWDPVFERMDKQMTDLRSDCEGCRSELAQVKKALRATVRALDRNDPDAVTEAIAEARQLI